MTLGNIEFLVVTYISYNISYNLCVSKDFCHGVRLWLEHYIYSSGLGFAATAAGQMYSE